MTIKTKFNIDDIVYFMYDNKVYNGRIKNIKIYIKSDNSIKNIYDIHFARGITYSCEEPLFKTKEELLKSL